MKNPSRRRILVVEDSEEDFDTVLEAALQMDLPDEVVRALNIQDALLALNAAHEAGMAFSLVLLDQSMPGGNGDELLGKLRACAAHRNLTVVILSGSTSMAECLHCYMAGATAYHVKPVNFQDHLKAVQSIFRYWMQAVRLPRARDLRPPT